MRADGSDPLVPAWTRLPVPDAGLHAGAGLPTDDTGATRDRSGPIPETRQRTQRRRRATVSTRAVVTMLVITGFVWGGFAVILSTAIRKEREKRSRP